MFNWHKTDEDNLYYKPLSIIYKLQLKPTRLGKNKMVYDVTSTYLGIVQSCQNADRDTDSTQPLNHLSTSIINDFVLQERKKVIKTIPVQIVKIVVS